jgi:hypothetical protein
MKPRTVLLSLALSALAACSGKVILLSGAPLTRGGVAGATTDAGNVSTAGSSSSLGSSGSTSLNVDAGTTTLVQCAAGQSTTVTGKVFDPRGRVPLYNAVVFVPDGTPPPFQPGVACETCKTPVQAKSVALTDATGSFTIQVPDANSVQLVAQLGKWRSFPTSFGITACGPNSIADPLLHLPANQAQGSIPKIALSTGHSDALECLLRKIGISDSEFTTDAGTGRVNMFVGCIGDSDNSSVPPRFGANKFAPALGGLSFPSTNELFDSGELSNYDMVIFSCEGHKCDTIQTPTNVDKLTTFANQGGRVYLDHDHYNWLNHASDKIESAAQFSSSPNDIPSPLTATINAIPAFPKGQAFAQWLVNVNASTTQGSLQIFSGKTSVESIDPNRAQSWIYSTDPATKDTFYFTIGTPVAVLDNTPAPDACGRVVFTDLHVSKSGGGCDASADCGESDDISDQDIPFPTGCTTTDLLPQEKALEFMIFDLSSCVQQESATPVPPTVIK